MLTPAAPLRPGATNAPAAPVTPGAPRPRPRRDVPLPRTWPIGAAEIVGFLILNGLLIGASGALLGAGAVGCDPPKETEPEPEDKLPPGNDKGDDNTICH